MSGIATALAAQRQAALLSRLPQWVDKTTCVLSEPKGKLQLTFHCCCALKKQQVSIRKGAASSEQEWASKLGSKVDEKHSICQPSRPVNDSVGSTLGSLPPPSDREKQLHREVITLKRKLHTSASNAELERAKAAKGAEAQKLLTESKRQDSIKETRRLEIDCENKEQLTVPDKSTAMRSDDTGMLDTMKYWARGSLAAVLQLIMALIHHFKVESEVAAELGLQQNETNQYIVDRLSSSLQILKQCRTEEQRQHYRVVLTAVAPVKVGEKHQGMSRRVAEALKVNRNRKPFRAAVDLRAEIDQAAKHMDDPLVVGDRVVTRHGVGTLTECGDRPNDPCCVDIKIGDAVHTSKFKSMGKGRGGGRVRREPISFSHKSRAARKDQIQDHVKDKVLHSLN